MEPSRPFHINLDSISLSHNFGGHQQLHFNNLQSLMHFVFSLNPHQLIPLDQPHAALKVILPIEQEGSLVGNVRMISGIPAEKEQLDPGVYFTFRSGMTTIWGATGFNMELMESNAYPHGTIQLARYYPDKDLFEWAIGYAQLKQQVLTTLGSDKSLHHPFVATVTIQGNDYSDPQKRQEYRTCYYFPDLPSAVKKALTSDYSAFQPQLLYNGQSAVSSVSLHTTDLFSADFYLARNGIESVVSGDGPPIPGIYLTFDMNQFPEPEDIENQFKWDLKRFDRWIPEMYTIVLARETFVDDYELTYDPHLSNVIQKVGEDSNMYPYELRVSGTYQQDELVSIPKDFTNIYYYTSFDEAMSHLLSINPRSMDLQHVYDQNEQLFIREAMLHCPKDIRYNIVVTKDLHNKWMLGASGAFLVRESDTLVPNTQFYQDDLLPAVVQLAGYFNDTKGLFAYTNLLQMQHDALALQSSEVSDRLASRFGKTQAEPVPEDVQTPPGSFLVVITGRMEITGIERTVCNSFDAAYKLLAELPAEALSRTAAGGYEDAQIFDHTGALLVSRYDHPGDAIIPDGIYTVVHCENLSSNILSTISTDLTIIGSYDEKFICRSATESSLQLQMRPSPLRISEIKGYTAGPHY